MKTLFFGILLPICSLNCPLSATFAPEEQQTYTFSLNYVDSSCNSFEFTGCRATAMGGEVQ